MNCFGCGHEIPEHENYVGLDGYYYCEDCFYDFYSYCDHCDELTSNDYMNYIDSIDRNYCNACYDDYMNSGIINSYHNRDIPIHFKSLDNENTELYYGFELEVENKNSMIENNEMAMIIRNQFENLELCFESDNSLDDGFEIISQPMSRKYIEKHAEDFQKILELLVEKGFKSHDGGNCGLHIHVSRAGLGDNQEKNIDKLLLFTETYKKELKDFSRRNNFEYCNFISDEGNKSFKNDRYYKSIKLLQEHCKTSRIRYQVINLLNEKTIEFRVFRGTLKYSTFKATLDFVDNLINVITKNTISKISWDKVINYNITSELKNYIETKNIFNSSYMTDESKNIDKEYKNKLLKLNKIEKEYESIIKNIYNDVDKYCKDINIDYTDNNYKNHIHLKNELYYGILSHYSIDSVDDESKNKYGYVLNVNFDKYNQNINELTRIINNTLCKYDNIQDTTSIKEKIINYSNILNKIGLIEGGEI